MREGAVIRRLEVGIGTVNFRHSFKCDGKVVNTHTFESLIVRELIAGDTILGRSDKFQLTDLGKSINL